MVFLEYINLEKIRKALLYLLCDLVAIWLQTTVFAVLAPLGVKPFFVPVIAVAVGLWEGGVWGGVLGLIAGLQTDMAYSESTVLYMVLFTAYGFAAGILGKYYLNRRFPGYVVISAAALVITAVCQIIPFWIFRSINLFYLLPVMGLQILWSLPFCLPAYFSVKAIALSDQSGD
ncbi:MAG: hypothetical protein IJU29_00300 [Oscillospiraceae bacterium]|nr:hypothetical protein [Oscillospiraceae bacterium]